MSNAQLRFVLGLVVALLVNWLNWCRGLRTVTKLMEFIDEAATSSVYAFNEALGGLVASDLLQLATGRLRQGSETYLMYESDRSVARMTVGARADQQGARGTTAVSGPRF